MKRIQIYIDEPLDRLLEEEAASRGTSKAALIREAAAHRYVLPAASEKTGWDALLGLAGDAEPIRDIDGFLYGPAE